MNDCSAAKKVRDGGGGGGEGKNAKREKNAKSVCLGVYDDTSLYATFHALASIHLLNYFLKSTASLQDRPSSRS